METLKAHKNFNRHELFNAGMMEDLGTVARELDSVEKFRDVHFDLQNKLYGLYDGYLYSDLLALAREADLPNSTALKLSSLVQRIEDYIAQNGETATRIF